MCRRKLSGSWRLYTSSEFSLITFSFILSVDGSLTVYACRHVYEALRHIWPDSVWATDRHFAEIESRL